MDDVLQYGVAAGVQAVNDSGIDFSKTDPTRCGAVCGAGIGGLGTIEAEYSEYLKAMSPRKISPFFVPATIINMIGGHLSIRFGLKGPNLGVVTACTTSTHAIGLGMRAIQYGDADLIVAGGGEMATTRCGLGSFGQAKALSTRNDAPKEASRGELDQVDDRASPRGSRGRRGDLLGARDPRRRRAAHHQLPHARPGVRPGLRAQHRPSHEDRREPVELLRLRRHERIAHLPALQRLTAQAPKVSPPRAHLSSASSTSRRRCCAASRPASRSAIRCCWTASSRDPWAVRACCSPSRA